jgi:hypothetical protein
MYQLTREELELWRSRIVISNPAARMALRRPPYALAEQGVAIISSVLRSDRAVKVNIAIMPAIARLRELLALHKDLGQQIEVLERKDAEHDARFRIVFEAIHDLAGDRRSQGAGLASSSGTTDSRGLTGFPFLYLLRDRSLRSDCPSLEVRARLSGAR